MSHSFNTIFNTIKQPGFIDDKQLDNYIKDEVKKAPYEEKAIQYQKIILQSFSVLAALTCLKFFDVTNTTEGKIAFLSCIGMSGVAFIRSKRQKIEKQLSFFKAGFEKFMIKEVLNSEPKTLNFLINPTYRKRLKTISNHSRNINKISLLTSVSCLGILSAFALNQYDFSQTLLSGALVLASSNVVAYLFAKRNLKKIKTTLPKGVSIPTLNSQHIKD